jgi:hypothetical protein
MYNGEVMNNSNISILNIIDNGTRLLNSNIPVIYNHVLDNNITYGNNSFFFSTSNLTIYNKFNTYVELPARICDFGASNTSISLWFRATSNYLDTIAYPSTAFTMNETKMNTSISSNINSVISSSVNAVFNISSFTNTYISGLNNYYQVGDGTNANRTGFVASWSTQTSIRGVQNPHVYRVFIPMDSSMGNIYLMDNGSLYYIGRNDLRLFDFNTTVVYPTMIRQFWDIDDSIVDVVMGNNTIYFLTTKGIIYGSGRNQYNNLYESGSTNSGPVVIHPIKIDSLWWNNLPVSCIATYGDCLLISTGVSVIVKGFMNSTTYSTWTVISLLPNIIKMFTPLTNRIYYVDIDNNYYYNGALFQLPNNQKVISFACATSTAVVLTDLGNVYTSSTNVFSTLVNATWGTDRIVKVSVGYYSSDIYYVYLSQSGRVYGSGSSTWGQLNTNTTVTNPTLIPLINTTNVAQVYDVYATNFGNLIALSYPSEMYNEFDGYQGEFIKYDNTIQTCITSFSLSVFTPYQVTLNRYLINFKLFGTNAADAMTNKFVSWKYITEINSQISYSASKQALRFNFANQNKYRFYTLLIYGNYNISIVDIFFYTVHNYYMTILSTNIDDDNGFTLGIEDKSLRLISKNNGLMKTFTYNKLDIYLFNHVVMNIDNTSNLLNLYINGIQLDTFIGINIPSGNYLYTYIGRQYCIDPVSGLYNYFTGNIFDFRIYNYLLSLSDIITLYRGNKINSILENNNYALISSDKYYLISTSSYLLNIMHTFGVLLTFMFKTTNMIFTPLVYIGRLDRIGFEICIINGSLYIIMGNYIVTSKKIIENGIWYRLELLTNILNNILNIHLYINDEKQGITCNKSDYLLTQTVMYDNSLFPMSDIKTYVGGYTTINYKNINDYTNDLLLTNTYYNTINNLSTINTTSALQALISSSNNIFRVTSNLGSLLQNTINTTATYMVNEFNGNVFLNEGYYNFAISTTQDIIGTEYMLGFDNIMINVAQYFGGSNIASSLNKPLYLNGYYKFYSRTLRTYSSNISESSNINIIYYVSDNPIDYYTITNPMYVYANVSNLNMYNSNINVTQCFINKNLMIDSNFYIHMTSNMSPDIYIQELKIYNNADNITSSIIQGLVDNAYYFNIKYTPYSETIDVNRWCKSDNYYMYNNGLMNRNIYYDEGTVGIGTTGSTVGLDIFTTTSGMNSIRTNNAMWISNNIATSSDKRIKKDIRDIDDYNALDTLIKLEPKMYNYIDVNMQKKDVYGFIAQQVAEVLPVAVTKESEFIPNIYAHCYVFDNMLVFVDEEYNVYDKIVIGDVIRIDLESGSRMQSVVMSIINRNTIYIDKDLGLNVKKCIVYGKLVYDFNVLNKNCIYTLNVCATQDLSRMIERQHVFIDMRDELIAELEQRVNRLL